MAPKPTAKFNEGEKVLCFHGPLLYEAKCVKTEVRDKVMKYFIHYSGWNKNWDEWVPESRVLKYNEASLQKQKELFKAHQHQKGAKGRITKAPKQRAEKEVPDKQKHKEDTPSSGGKVGRPPKAASAKATSATTEERSASPAPNSTPKSRSQRSSAQAKPTTVKASKPGRPALSRSETATPTSTSVAATPGSSKDGDTASSEPKKKRFKADQTVETEETYMSKIDVKIKIPEELKPWLVDDWDLINRQRHLLVLPAKMTVEDILEDYVKHKLSKPNNPQKDAILEVTAGVREYFNALLGTQLLYKFERPQYAELIANHPDQQMHKLYGAMHLLRLFVKMGSMLAYTSLEEKSMTLLLSNLHDILKYLQNQSVNLFSVDDYTVAPPEYHRKAI